MMHKAFFKMFGDLNHQIENLGDKLVITIKGDKDKLAKLEKTLSAVKNLHEACCDADGKCDCGCDCGCGCC